MPGRPRAPTITVDTTAVGSPEDSQIPLQPMSNPTSPQEPEGDSNHLNPNAAGNFLSVPSTSPTGSTLVGDTNGSASLRASSDADRSYFGGDATGEQIKPEDVLRPDPGTEQDFEVENNPFAYSPGQLGKLYNPKSLQAFYALGGVTGLERGLRTDLKSGLSSGEQHLQGHVSFDEVTTSPIDTGKGKGIHEYVLFPNHTHCYKLYSNSPSQPDPCGTTSYKLRRRI